MRPKILFPLFSDISSLAGVGEKTREVLKRLAGERVVNMVYHLPSSVVDRRNMPQITQMREGDIVTSVVQIDDYISPARPSDKNSPFKVRCYNESGYLTLVFFNAYQQSLERQMPKGSKKVVSGKVGSFNGEIQIVQPDHVAPAEELEKICRVEPVYPLAGGIAKKNLLKIINDGLKRVPVLPEWINELFIKQNKWHPWHECIIKSHRPEDSDDVQPASPHRSRLAYDELLANQLALALVRTYVNKTRGNPHKGDGVLRKKLLEKLPFELTDGQKEIINEINADQESENRMMRLLQGDVGSGKTVVSLMCALNSVEAGFQVAIMAPTEILAIQHAKWISQMTDDICKTELLIGKTKGKERERVLDELKSGDIDIIIGTHALFQ
jgi:ATP-dependent DNA helicase RecG